MGPISRWGFRHPGPALFYVYDLGEAVFHDLLKIVPAPCNAQVLANVLLTSFFLAAALIIIARWTDARCFVPLALIIGVLHFAKVGLFPFLSVWAAHPPILIFLCLLAAGASVAAGHAAHLPLLVLAGGFLVHIHVSQALFVVPIALLAYASFQWRQPAATDSVGGWRHWLPQPWRAFPRAHWIAASMLALFLLPLVIDAARGERSNLARILEYQRSHGGSRHAWACRSSTSFGSYLSYAPGRAEFDSYSGAEAVRFLQAHWQIYAAWLLAWWSPRSRQ